MSGRASGWEVAGWARAQAWRRDAGRSMQDECLGVSSGPVRVGSPGPSVILGQVFLQAGTPQILGHEAGLGGLCGTAYVLRQALGQACLQPTLCAHQASWRGRPPWPSTMETTAPHPRGPTWGPRQPRALAGRPWCGPSSLPLRSCCAGPAARHLPGSASDRAGGRARWAGLKWCGAGGFGSAGSRPGRAGRSCPSAAPCGWRRCGPAAPGGCT